jgi:hypothetical protein
MILKSRIVQATICGYWLLNCQLIGPRNLAQAVIRLTIRNVPDSNLGPVIVNRNVPSHATKTCRRSTGTATLIFNIGQLHAPASLPTNYPDKLFYGFIQTPGKCRHIMYTTTTSFQEPKQLNRYTDYAKKLMVQGSSPSRGKMFIFYPKRTDLLWGPPSCFSGG